MRDALAFMQRRSFALPPFVLDAPQDWKGRGEEYAEIIDHALGWDITDFGSGDFYNTGLLLITLRNGSVTHPEATKLYAEKIMVVREGQVTPMHYHYRKVEDIINRGGGNLMVKLYNRTDADTLAATEVTVRVDGVLRRFAPGAVIRLTPGSSICMERGLYHAFWGERGAGTVLVGEVSMVNDDDADNRFLEAKGRFPEIEEDEAPLHLLCNEYRKWL